MIINDFQVLSLSEICEMACRLNPHLTKVTQILSISCWFISQYANWRHADLFFIFLLTRKLYNSLLGSHLPRTEYEQWIYFSQWGLENDLFIDANRSKETTGRIWREFESFRFLFKTSKTSTGIFRFFSLDF